LADVLANGNWDDVFEGLLNLRQVCRTSVHGAAIHYKRNAPSITSSDTGDQTRILLTFMGQDDGSVCVEISSGRPIQKILIIRIDCSLTQRGKPLKAMKPKSQSD
jgi:hypothetical protein